MRQSHRYALVGAVVLIAALAFVLTPDQIESAEVAPAPEFSSQPPTTFPLVLAVEAPGSDELDEAEDELSEQAVATTTTTTLASTTTEAEAPAPTTGSGGSGGSSGNSGGSGSTPTTSPPATDPPANEGAYNSGYESDFRSRINSLRSSNGLPSLASDGSLNGRARSWAKSMAEDGQLKHSNIGNLLPPWRAAAENVGAGGSVSGVFEALSNSSGHRANMLGRMPFAHHL